MGLIFIPFSVRYGLNESVTLSDEEESELLIQSKSRFNIYMITNDEIRKNPNLINAPFPYIHNFDILLYCVKIPPDLMRLEAEQMLHYSNVPLHVLWIAYKMKNYWVY